jgi:hypothetical protein
MRCGYVYLAPLYSDVYGYVPTRTWWKPWRFTLRALYYDMPFDEVISTNLTRAECVGLMQLFGVKNVERQ